MAIDVYHVPAEHKVYERQNLFSRNTEEVQKSSIGVNIYQNFAYTQANSQSFLSMTTGAKVVLNHWAEVGVFCNYWFPKADPIVLSGATEPTMNLGNYVYCGNTFNFVPWADKIVHPRIGFDIGLGTATETHLTSLGKEKQIGFPFLILKPGIFLDVNVLSFLQWSFGFAYRFQISLHGPDQSSTFDSKADWPEFSTGPVFNVR